MAIRILVVEDDEPSLEYLTTLLRGWGYIVDQARNGAEALHSMQQACPNVLISDLVMPGINGIELLRAIRGQLQKCPVFFILLTGYATPSAAVQAIIEGADECMLKPVEADVLHEILIRYEYIQKEIQ